MKYLLLFESHKETDKHGKVLSKYMFNKYYNLYCQQHKAFGDNAGHLYRAIRDVDFDYLYQYPKNNIRRSIEKANIHVQIMSTMPEWKGFPIYNKSVVASNKPWLGIYGENKFEYIPFDGVDIGMGFVWWFC